MEQEIASLSQDKKHWKEIRRKHSADTPEWEDDNAQYKLLSRFLYNRLVSDLEDLIDDKELDDSEVDDVEKALQKFMNF